MRVKKILIDARESGATTGRYVDKLIEYLSYVNTSYRFIVLTKGHRVEYLQKIAPEFEIVESPYKEFTFAEQIALLWQILSKRPDLVHFSLVQQPIAYFGKTVTGMLDLTTIRFGNPSKNKVIFLAKQFVYKLVNYVAAKKSAKIITLSNFVKQDVINIFRLRQDKVVVTYCASDAIVGSPRPVKELLNKEFIMYVGRPMPHKNLSRLLDTFTLLQKSYPNLRLALVGKEDANYQAHKERVKKEGIKHVIFTGFIEDIQLKWMYENTMVYVFPSLSEGFGLPGLEAMTHGAAVASSNASCLPEIYGDAARYFDPLNVDDMAAKISDLLGDKKLRDELIAKGHQQVKKYSWRRMAEQTLAIYNQALASQAPAKK